MIKSLSNPKYSEKLSFPVLYSAFLISSYFYCLPLGRFSIFGIGSDFRLYDFAMIIFFFLFAPNYLFIVKKLWQDKYSFHYWGKILLIFVIMTIPLTLITGGELQQFPVFIRTFRFIGYILIPSFIIALLKSSQEYKFLIYVFYINIVIQSVIAFGQGMGFIPNLWPDYWIQTYFAGGVRPVGTLSPHHKQIGIVMLMGIGMTLAFLRINRSFVFRMFLLLFLSMMIAVPLFAGSRSSWLGFLGLLLGFFVTNRMKAIRQFIVLIFAFGIILYLMPGTVSDKIERQYETRLTERLEKSGLDGIARERTKIYFKKLPATIQESPFILFTGSGFMNAPTFILGATAAHNNYLQVLFELGIVGFLIYIKFLKAVILTFRKTISYVKSQFEKYVTQSAFSIFIAILITMFVGETFWPVYSMFTLTGQIMMLIALSTSPLKWVKNKSEVQR